MSIFSHEIELVLHIIEIECLRTLAFLNSKRKLTSCKVFYSLYSGYIICKVISLISSCAVTEIVVVSPHRSQPQSFKGGSRTSPTSCPDSDRTVTVSPRRQSWYWLKVLYGPPCLSLKGNWESENGAAYLTNLSYLSSQGVVPSNDKISLFAIDQDETIYDEIQCHFIVDQILESVFTLAQDQYGYMENPIFLHRKRACVVAKMVSDELEISGDQICSQGTICENLDPQGFTAHVETRDLESSSSTRFEKEDGTRGNVDTMLTEDPSNGLTQPSLQIEDTDHVNIHELSEPHTHTHAEATYSGTDSQHDQKKATTGVSWATRNNNSRTAKVENYWNTVHVSRSRK
ncbi:hypothetical protein JHK82_028141 [Glycine max]|nr:hypothetical protein JHK85_028805 [Glycine max]KAG5004126.1 hypothetical protein JHK86_028265 [Glycine max]KAG5127306.1 hypothetical protein JHK82_028141 [Glycine max]KAG5151920.1 hypothetical protein JHK84_028392 [Glycine max]